MYYYYVYCLGGCSNMFNITKAVKQLKQLSYCKIHGLPYKRPRYDSKVPHIDDTPFDIKAEQENTYIKRSFRNYSVNFGRRLSKRKGQYHRPGGSRTNSPRIVYSLYQEI